MTDNRSRPFEFHIELDAEQLWQRLCARDDVRVSDEPAPAPPPPHGAPFLAARLRPTELLLRRWAGPEDAASPIVVLELEQAKRGCVVRGHFARGFNRSLRSRRIQPRMFLAPAAGLLIALAIGGYVLGGGWAALLLPVLLVLFAIPAGVVMVPMLMLWNAQSRALQVNAMLELVGEVFTPIALPPAPGDPTPFR